MRTAKRRVSFAPEATLHTWDVIEYMRDATTSSSASSESTRRASSITENTEPRSPALPGDAEPPSTPPEQVEEDVTEASEGIYILFNFSVSVNYFSNTTTSRRHTRIWLLKSG